VASLSALKRTNAGLQGKRQGLTHHKIVGMGKDDWQIAEGCKSKPVLGQTREHKGRHKPHT